VQDIKHQKTHFHLFFKIEQGMKASPFTFGMFCKKPDDTSPSFLEKSGWTLCKK
jgi:hypothetical protein